MVITFQELRFKNILSYGAQETVIEFTKGINLISGKNGEGKSTILDALSFCLFGKPYRDIKIKDLVNRRNRKALKTSCIFTMENGDVYQIIRTLNPDSLEILKNKSESELLSSKKLNQEELNKILGIDYNLFRQVISLAINYNKPFLSLPLQEKRDIIERIFNITVFGQMLKEAKTRNSNYIMQNEINKNSLSLLRENVSAQRENINNLMQIQNNFELNKTKELENINKKIQTTEKELEDVNNIITTTQNLITDICINLTKAQIETNKNKLNEIVKIINNEEYIINNNTKIIKNLETDIICSRCNTTLTEEHKQQEIIKLTAESKSITDSLQKQKILKKEIDDIIFNLENKKMTYQDLKSTLDINIQNKNHLDSVLSQLNETKLQIENKKFDVDIDKMKIDFGIKTKEWQAVNKNTINIQQIMTNYKSVFEILSETGIKAFFFKKLIPILNSKINEYLRLFEIPIILMFDPLMNEQIKTHEQSKSNISYYSYSEGEKKRIDMAILLSFINITKSISNWNCNLLLIDELLDGAIDEAGLNKLVTSLKNMADDSNMSIYIISHRLHQEYSSKFNRCFFVNKTDSFSKIKCI